jgi:dipeptidyl aminopeptidase/acylaminoacyl peptidase
METADTAGTALWQVDRHGSRRLLAINTFLADVEPSGVKRFTYLSGDSELLAATLRLPIGYQPGRRYPVVCVVYAGDAQSAVSDTTTSRRLFAGTADPTDPELLAAHGYVVLEPSIPLTDWGGRGNPFLDIPKGLLPAVAELVHLGIADPDRIGIYGHSYGGYTALSAIGYSHWFKAAVASSSGGTDMMSFYGSLLGGGRYRRDVISGTGGGVQSWIETGQFRMGEPLLDNPLRYLENSPVLYSDRVTTPLLLIDGDQDIAVEQSDEVFMNLYRLGKRVRYVRYLGEGHVVQSPANFRDMCREVFAWFDHYLGPN